MAAERLESSPLLVDEAGDGESVAKGAAVSGWVRRRAALAVSFLVCVAAFDAAVRGRQGGDLAATAREELPATADAAIGFIHATSDAYASRPTLAAESYAFLEGKLLVEPHRNTTLTLTTESGVAVDSTVSPMWSLMQRSNTRGGGGSGDSAASTTSTSSTSSVTVTQTGEGMSWNLHFNSLGSYDLSLRFYYSSSSDAFSSLDSSGSAHRITATMQRTLECRYVRRSLRRLLDDERDEFFDAVLLMSLTPMAEGKQRFGSDFRSIDYFVEMHLESAAAREVDRLHDGMGFLTQHVALTSEFELALQALRPHLAVPFWDYTYDWHVANASLSDGASGDPLATLWGMDVWADDWFGTSGGEYHTVTSGRFAYLELTNNRSKPTTNAYGFLRAPWNVNRSPYLTRVHTFCGSSYSWRESTLDAPLQYNSWPSCKVHWQLTYEVDSWYDWVWYAPYQPHGPVHFMVGGYTNCGDWEAEIPSLGGAPKPDGQALTAEESARHELSLDFIKGALIDAPKNMWRDHMLEFPTYCSDDTPQADCHVVCGDHATDTTSSDPGWKDTFFNVSKSGAGGSTDWGDWIRRFPTARYDEFVSAFCTTPFTPGEQMEAASPVDPSFWPIHPTMDRLLQHKRVVLPFTDAGWASPDGDTSYCQAADTGCEGHHAEDLTMWATHHEEDDGSWVRSHLTNAELFRLSDPSSSNGNDYRLAYVYDDFVWEHCEEEGHHFLSRAEARLAHSRGAGSGGQ